MKYEVKTHGRIGPRLQRVAEREIAAALAELESIGHADVAHATHEARKHFKKLRTLLRLVRAGLGAAAVKTENACFREAGRRLQPLRDAQVLVRALDALRQRSCRDRHPAVVTHARRLLIGARQRVIARCLRAHAAAEVSASLNEALGRIRQWDLASFRWKDCRRAIGRSYRCARRAHRAAMRDPSDTRLHTWRKRVKDLGYHARLLRSAAPAVMDLFIQELDTLTEFLGDDRDLAILRAALLHRRKTLQRPRQFTVLIHLLDLRRRELHAAAFGLGSHLFADSAADFTRALEARRSAGRALAVQTRQLLPRIAAA